MSNVKESQAALRLGMLAAYVETAARDMAGKNDEEAVEQSRQVSRIVRAELMRVATHCHVEAPSDVLDSLVALHRMGLTVQLGRLADRLWGWADVLADSGVTRQQSGT